MSSQTRRGRKVQARRGLSGAQLFYVALGAIALIGVAVLAVVFLRPQAATPTGSLEGFPSKGSADAPVTVVEYADYQCPGCAAFATQVGPGITTDYVDTGKIRFVFHEYPLGQHRNAVPAAEAARCAGDQNAYWPMHDLLFAQQQAWANLPQPQQQFVAYANQLGLDQTAFAACLTDHTHRDAILQARQQAEAARIPVTPSFVINGTRYEMAQLRDAIDRALAEQEG